jgi:glycosyltransferase involved in cell wall biosynthesis
MRVAFVIPYLRGRGGWPTVAKGAVRALSAWVDPVLVVARSDAREAKRLFPEWPVVIVPVIQPLEHQAIFLLPKLLPTWVWIRSLPPLGVDLVHALEAFPAGWVGQWLARREKVPLILTAHGTYAVVWRTSWGLSQAYAGVLRDAAAVCPVSSGTGERIKQNFPNAISDERMEVILQGTDETHRVPAEQVQAHPFPMPPALLSVGNLKERKGYHISLRAFAELQKEYPAARYRIAGSGLGSKYHKKLQNQIRRLGLRNVDFLGPVDRESLDRLYAESSVFVLTSQEERDHFEGFGLVFLEAGAHGLPVIGSRSGGISDAVQDGKTGFLFDPLDIPAIASGMIQLVREPDLARRLGQNGRMLAESLSWERYANQQRAVYQRVLNARAES